MSAIRDRVWPSLQTLGPTLRDPNLRRLQLAFIGFNVSEWATWIAMLVFAYEVGGVTAAGLVALIQLAPAAIAAPFVALLGDRFPRERVLVVGYLVQAACMGGTAAAILGDAPTPVVYTLAAFAATSITVTRPVQGALLPALSRTPEELTASNATSSIVEGLSVLAGPALASVLLARWGPGIVFAVAGLWLLASALLASGIRVERGLDLVKAPGYGLVRDAFRGFRALAREPGPRLVVALGGAQTLVWGALDVLIVVLALELLDLGDPGVGFLNSAFGLGGLLGGLATVSLVGRRRLAPALIVGVMLWGVPLALVGLVPGAIGAAALLSLAGGGHSVMDVTGRTLLQRIVPDEVLSRVLGVLEGLIMGGLALGSILAPALVALLGARGALIAAGSLLPLLGMLAWSHLRRIDAAVPVPVREIRLLRALPIFAPLPVPALERLAGNLSEVHVPAGTAVVEEGAAGDRFYVISKGQLRVSIGGRPGVTLGPGESFGEIALLRDVPRTATVTALADAELFALERDLFLEVVTGHPMSLEAAESVVIDRIPSDRTHR